MSTNMKEFKERQARMVAIDKAERERARRLLSAPTENQLNWLRNTLRFYSNGVSGVWTDEDADKALTEILGIAPQDINRKDIKEYVDYIEDEQSSWDHKDYGDWDEED